jgi:signal transduction histidine kinase
MDHELKILMLEDLPEDAGLVDRALRKEKMNFTSLRVDSRDEFIRALDEFKPDVILSDHALPQFNSIDALRACMNRKLNIPFILVTGAVSEEFAVNCLKRGADDYVLKSNLSRLPLAIRYALRQHRYESNRQAQEEMLRKQNDELVKINRELDAFVYSVSHDLRSPLASILGLINIARLEKDNNPDKMLNYLGMIQRSVLKLDDTLREILNYSKNARGELVITEVNLELIIQKILDQMAYLDGAEQIQYDINVHGHTALYSDEFRLSVIIANLLSNAIKYADRRKTHQVIEVNATITPANLTMMIRDNGIGIPREQLSRVFGMFYRATEKSQGAGLGLYIVKEIVDKLEGTITITSEPGAETQIRITIPNQLIREQ